MIKPIVNSGLSFTGNTYHVQIWSAYVVGRGAVAQSWLEADGSPDPAPPCANPTVLVRLVLSDGSTRAVLLAIESLGAGRGVVLAANRTANSMRVALHNEGMDLRPMQFLDCVSSLSGMSPPPEPGVLHVESPTMLEKIAMRCEQLLRAMPAPRYLVVDSLTALSVYNGSAAVAEFTHHVVNRMRALGVPTVFLAVERAGELEMRETVGALCDAVQRV